MEGALRWGGRKGVDWRLARGYNSSVWDAREIDKERRAIVQQCEMK
jgi:hypothetical protein